ncbi:enoyl-CoA-hydratase DpgB [Spongiactinospora sp. TRM90649]|uniref:enoyl-CoA-hydratase DpgB n=1 Tax=Spongiactinospora sp. TRM90649 TaxID=3031114 RepID=UPI0023F8CB81|nr:enoyl-CoA-hydratase DpgB [Spongiactinospora sp. TRM90649]MDF5753137.1 enoyl-CoA hydratase/isomerase family protein [Spongiactinospora sp. TRM90649]
MTGRTGIEDGFTLRIDGARPVTADSVEAIAAMCDAAEDHGGPGVVTLRVSGAPGHSWTTDLSVGLVSKWERALLRLERLPMVTVAVASGDCGGAALDVLLTADLRVAAPGTRLLVATDGDATWPGMALHRLTQQAGTGGIRAAAMLGVPIEADEALALRLLDRVSDDLAGAVADAAARAAALAGSELAIRRRLVLDAGTTTFEDALGAHLAACDRALRRGAGR